MLEEDEKIPFTSHLEELRSRLIKCFIAVGVGFALSYGFKEILFEILVRPLIQVMAEGDHLIFTGLPEAFFTYLKVALLSGLMLASPWVFYQIWAFVAAGLYKHEKKWEKAVYYLKKSIELDKESKSLYILSDLHHELGLLYEEMGDIKSAKKHIEIAIKHYNKMGHGDARIMEDRLLKYKKKHKKK